MLKKLIYIASFTALGLGFTTSAFANDRAFMNWCTKASANTTKTCACANQRVKQSTAPGQVQRFVANGGKITLDKDSIAVADAIARALQACKR